MDIVNPGADGVGVVVAFEGFEQIQLRAGGLDGDDVGIEAGNVLDDVIELGIAHVGVDLRGVANPVGAQAKARHRPVEVGCLLGFFER